MKAIECINDPLKYIEVFKLTCYHYLGEYDVFYKTIMYFSDKREFYPYFEKLVSLQTKLKQWKKWIADDVHTEEEYIKEWFGKEDLILPEFKEIYHKIENCSIERFPFIDRMNLIDSGFILTYINKIGHECDLEV